jgi:hypothetical protein
MSSDDRSPVLRRPNLPQTIEGPPRSSGLPVEIQGKMMEAGIDVATAVCKVVINAANVTVEGKRLEQEAQAQWEATRQRIAEIDAQALAEIAKLRQSLETEKETTKKLEIITNLIHSHPNLPKEIAEGLREALINLTVRG